MVAPNILITGAAGYIGGSVVAELLAKGVFKPSQVSVAVRSEEQARALSRLGVNVLRLNLSDENAVIESVLRYAISIVIQTASSIDPTLSLPLITALSKYREISGQETYYLYTSGLSAFYQKTGWPPGTWSDSGPVFDAEKELQDSFPIRKTDVAVTEHAKSLGVTSFIVVPCTVYGKGTGKWNKLSVILPPYVQASIAQKAVYKFPENTRVSYVHIKDLAALYQRIVDKILQKEPLSSGPEGYYFALAHNLAWWEVLDRLAVALHARGLVNEPNTNFWLNDEAAAEALGVPVQFLQVLWNSGDDLTTENTKKIGWQPTWDSERFLENISDEIDAVQEEGKAKSSLMDSLFAAARG